MECPRCKLPMKIEVETEKTTIWRCKEPDCGYTKEVKK